jgi:uncharacterized membrane protein YtjA (UPF0391 family)
MQYQNQCFLQRFDDAPPGWHVFSPVSLNLKQTEIMLRWTLTFLVIALIAAVFGFTGIAAGAASIAKIIFYIFLVFFVISLITGAFRRSD